MKKIIKIEGMHCKHCGESVKKALEALGIVKSARIDLKKNIATIDIGKNNEDGLDITRAVENAGFKVMGIENKKTLF